MDATDSDISQMQIVPRFETHGSCFLVRLYSPVKIQKVNATTESKVAQRIVMGLSTESKEVEANF